MIKNPRVLAPSRFCDGFDLKTGSVASCLGKLISPETECRLFVASQFFQRLVEENIGIG